MNSELDLNACFFGTEKGIAQTKVCAMPLAQRKGFEPLVLLWEYTRFRVVRVRPLRHLCIRRFARLRFIIIFLYL